MTLLSYLFFVLYFTLLRHIALRVATHGRCNSLGECTYRLAEERLRALVRGREVLEVDTKTELACDQILESRYSAPRSVKRWRISPPSSTPSVVRNPSSTK